MKTTISKSKIPIFCDNKATISLSKNPTFTSRAEHIEIKHHSIRDHIQNGTVDLQFVPINDQLAGIIMKPLIDEKLIMWRSQLGMISINEWFNLYMSCTVASKDILSNGL